MSYRDIRNLVEMLRALGYPNLVSMESFRTPNFPLVAHLLTWLTKRFESDVDISCDIDSQTKRVNLIRNVAEFMALKANIKLNTKKLYQADGYAVKELLKITTLLYDALQVTPEHEDDNDDDVEVAPKDFDFSDKVNDLKQSRQLASEITTAGARLFDLLGKETEMRGARSVSAGRQYEVNDVEAGIRQAMDAVRQEIEETKQMADNVSAAESNLDSKIERRKVEIERYEKRLQTLKKVRPAFLDEFLELEKDLEGLFVQYSIRVRCLNHLERLASEAERSFNERQQKSASHRTIETVPLETTEGGHVVDLEEDLGPLPEEVQKPERPSRARTAGRRTARTSKPIGTLNNPMLSDGSGSADLSSESESEDLLLEGDDADLGQSDEDSFALELSAMDKPAVSGRITSTKHQDHSDDDF